MPPDHTPQITPKISPELDAASAWFARLQGGKMSAAERQAFQQWLQENPAHQGAYAQVQRFWQSPTLDAALLHYADIPVKPRPRHKARRLAAACLIIACGWGLQALGLIDGWRADYVTATGEQRSFTLADGSTVTLNTDSALQIENSQHVRQVRLLRGEAYFNVQPNQNQPFIVSADNSSVRVVGTRFTVRSGGQTQVAVEHGIVECANGRGDKTQLNAGQQTLMDNQQASSAIAIDGTQAFAWTNGRLVFKNRSLNDVIAELDRYQPGSIVIANAKLAQTRVSGNYKLRDIPAIVKTLAGITSAKVTSLSPYLTVLR